MMNVLNKKREKKREQKEFFTWYRVIDILFFVLK